MFRDDDALHVEMGAARTVVVLVVVVVVVTMLETMRMAAGQSHPETAWWFLPRHSPSRTPL